MVLPLVKKRSPPPLLEIQLDGRTYPVRVRRNARSRRVRMQVAPGRIEVVAPVGVESRRVLSLLMQHSGWLRDGLRKAGEVPKRVLPPAIELAALGQSWSIAYVVSSRSYCREGTDGRLEVGGGEPPARQQALRRWLFRTARAHLVPRLRGLSEELGLTFNKATVRGQKTRWGSCSVKGDINLNYRLLFLPPALVRYLFVHELCHTVHHNHSSRYWSLVGSCEPDYRRLDRQLRVAFARLPEWLTLEGW